MTPTPTGPGQKIKRLIVERVSANRAEVEAWFRAQAAKAPPPVYCSIDLRDFGHKVVPVDSNLFPAGFNNICPEDLRTAPPLMRAEIDDQLARLGHAAARKILVLPESHTQNAYYIENLAYLTDLLRESGLEVRIGWYGEAESTAPIPLKSATGKELQACPIRIEGGVLSAGDFVPDVILLNNDFSAGYPERLDPVAQPILPDFALGWHTRKKSEHFRHYNALAAEFAQLIGIDPWTIQVQTEAVEPADFNEGVGIEATAAAVDRIAAEMKRQYDARKITRKPIVFVKNNSGTYGMGIMVVSSGEEILKLNRRAKNKMSVGKGKSAIESLCVQEGVPTTTLVDRLAAEPVIYLSGSKLIGGFLRTNTEKTDEDNLNSQGMVFRMLCMSDLRKLDEDPPEPGEKPTTVPLLEQVYGSIARISALAAGREIAEYHASCKHPKARHDAVAPASAN